MDSFFANIDGIWAGIVTVLLAFFSAAIYFRGPIKDLLSGLTKKAGGNNNSKNLEEALRTAKDEIIAKLNQYANVFSNECRDSEKSVYEIKSILTGTDKALQDLREEVHLVMDDSKSQLTNDELVKEKLKDLINRSDKIGDKLIEVTILFKSLINKGVNF